MTERSNMSSRSQSSSRSRSRSRSSRSSRSSGRHSYNRRSRSPRRENPEPASCLGIFNLHPMATERDLQDLFGSRRYGEIRDIKVIRDHATGRSKCYGFVYYVNIKDAILAKKELNNAELKHKIIRVDYSYSKDKGSAGNSLKYYERQRSPDYSRSRYRSRSRSPPGYSRRSRHSRSRSPLSSSHNHYRNSRSSPTGSNYRSYGSSRRDDPIQPNKCIGVFNLHKSTDEDTLRSIFRKFGPIETVRIVKDHDTNKSKGYAFIYFDSEDSAIESCKRMNQQEINGNIIRVDFSRSNAKRESNQQRRRRSVSFSPGRNY